MKKYILALIVSCFMLIGTQTQGWPAIIEIIPDNTQITTNGETYHPTGGTVSFDVIIKATEDNEVNLANYWFDIWYDASELTVTSAENTMPTAWFPMDEVTADTSEVPYIKNIEGFVFFNYVPLRPDGVNVAHFEFETHNLQNDGNPDISVHYRLYPNGELYDMGMTIQLDDESEIVLMPESIGPDVAPVPIPAGVWLLGSGLVGLLGLKRMLAIVNNAVH